MKIIIEAEQKKPDEKEVRSFYWMEPIVKFATDYLLPGSTLEMNLPEDSWIKINLLEE